MDDAAPLRRTEPHVGVLHAPVRDGTRRRLVQDRRRRHGRDGARRRAHWRQVPSVRRPTPGGWGGSAAPSARRADPGSCRSRRITSCGTCSSTCPWRRRTSSCCRQAVGLNGALIPLPPVPSLTARRCRREARFPILGVDRDFAPVVGCVPFWDNADLMSGPRRCAPRRPRGGGGAPAAAATNQGRTTDSAWRRIKSPPQRVQQGGLDGRAPARRHAILGAWLPAVLLRRGVRAPAEAWDRTHPLRGPQPPPGAPGRMWARPPGDRATEGTSCRATTTGDCAPSPPARPRR